MIHGKYLSIKDDLSDVVKIRIEVFEKELAFLDNIGIDSNDELAINVIVYDKEIPVGTGRIILDYDGDFTIDMVCVLSNYRKKGYGEFIVRLLADKALLSGGDYIHLLATDDTVSFFEKLDFKKDTVAPRDDDLVSMTLKLSDFTTPCGHNCKK